MGCTASSVRQPPPRSTATANGNGKPGPEESGTTTALQNSVKAGNVTAEGSAPGVGPDSTAVSIPWPTDDQASNTEMSSNPQTPPPTGLAAGRMDKVFHQGWLRKQPLKPQDSRHAFSKWKMRYFCLVQVEGIVWLAYYTDMTTTNYKGAIPLWKTSYVASVGNPLIVVICNNGPENLELIVQAESISEARKWSNMLNDTISTHASQYVSLESVEQKIGRNIRIIDDAVMTTQKLKSTPTPGVSSEGTSAVDSEASLIATFQAAGVLDNRTADRPPQRTPQKGRPQNENTSNTNSTVAVNARYESPDKRTETGTRSSTGNMQDSPPLPRHAGRLRSALLRVRRSPNPNRYSPFGMKTRGSDGSPSPFGFGFDRLQVLQKTLTTAGLDSSWTVSAAC